MERALYCIESIGQAIPTYTMSVFKLSAGLCEVLTSMLRRYWRGAEKGKKRKTHWVTWKKLLLCKDRGGLGFRDIAVFNQALLGRTSGMAA